MSRLPLGPLTSMTAVETPVEEDDGLRMTNLINDRILAVEVETGDDHSVLVVNVHLKAGGGGRNSSWRQGQVELIRDFIEDEQAANPDLNVVVLGDFNSSQRSSEMGVLLRPDEGRGLHQPSSWQRACDACQRPQPSTTSS